MNATRDGRRSDMTDTKFDHYAGKARRHDHGDHTHDDHAPATEHDDGPPGEFEIMSRAMQELLEDKGVVTADEIRQRMESFDDDFPFRGSKVVAKAWLDPDFKRRLLEDGKA